MTSTPRLGLISDTHDLLRPGAVEVLKGCEAILHAGDICTLEILESLRKLGPVVAVRGNNDRDERLGNLPDSQVYEWREVRILLVHDRSEITTVPPDIDV
ncbi:MAG: metallophosphatase family protein, partial [Acidobacteria bacterium]|nr:metallophosphatase family protein [Acidobacteriota bacterium]